MQTFILLHDPALYNDKPCTLYHADQKHWCKLFLVLLAILMSRLYHLLHHLSEMYLSRTCWGHIQRLFWSCRDWVDREGDRKCNAINFPWWLSWCVPRDPASVRSPSNLELQWENIFFSEFLWKTAMTKCLRMHCFERHQRKIMLRGTSNSSIHHYTPFSPALTVIHFLSAGINLQNVSVQAVWPHRLSFSSTY